MDLHRGPSNGSWDQGTLHGNNAPPPLDTPPIQTAPRRDWDKTNATSAAAAYQQDSYGKEPYSHEAQSLYTSGPFGPRHPSHAATYDAAQQSPPRGRSMMAYGGPGAFQADSPSGRGSPNSITAVDEARCRTSRSRDPLYPPRPQPRRQGTAASITPHSPSRMPPRSRKNSHDWGKLMKDAGYTWDPTQDGPGASQTAGLGSDSAVKGPLSWLRSVMHASRIVTWFVFIVPVLGILWVPGIIALVSYDARPHNNFANPKVFSTGIFWWSVWLSAVWLGWWICRGISGLAPRVLQKMLGSVAVATELGIRKTVDYFIACETYVALFMQMVLIWVLWLTVIWNHYESPTKYSVDDSQVNPLLGNSTTTATGTSASNSTGQASTSELFVTISRFWFGLVLCTALLLVEKLFVQSIAYSFHQATYADRLAASRFQVAVLSTLFQHSSASLSRKDTVLEAEAAKKTKTPKLLLPFASASRSKGNAGIGERFRDASQNTGTVLGNVALELKESKSVLSLTNPRYIVLSALESSKETRKLARRIFYSYSRRNPEDPSTQVITIDSFLALFPDHTTATAAFNVFDVDGNGDLSREELEAACLGVMRDRMALVNSMHDVDSAVSSLDNLFMSVYVLIAAVIIAAMLSTKFSTLVTSLGSVVLGLSWLFSASAAESFSAVVFLIAKHPYDTGDRVDVQGMGNPAGTEGQFEVVELGLLSTTFRTLDGRYVQIANAQLALKAITNHRRSGPIEEPFKLDLLYTTTFAQLEALRTRMVNWIETQGRDYRPGLDIIISSLGDQSKLQITAGIRYKSNLQDAGLMARRRNKWVCALRGFMAELEIFGPAGDPNALPLTQHWAQVEPVPEPEKKKKTSEDGHGDGDEKHGNALGLRDDGGETAVDPPEYKLMDSKQTDQPLGGGSGVVTPGIHGLGGRSSALGYFGGGTTTGYNTPTRTGANTPVRAQSPTRLSQGDVTAAFRRRAGPPSPRLPLHHQYAP